MKYIGIFKEIKKAKKILWLVMANSASTFIKIIAGLTTTKIVALIYGPTGIYEYTQLQYLVTGLNGIISAPAGEGVVRYSSENNTDFDKNIFKLWSAAIQQSIIIFFIISFICLINIDHIGNIVGLNLDYWLLSEILISSLFYSFGFLLLGIVSAQKNYNAYIGLGVLSTVGGAIVGICFLIGTSSIAYGLITNYFSTTLFIVLIILLNKLYWAKVKNFILTKNYIEHKKLLNYVFMAIFSWVLAPISQIYIRNIISSNSNVIEAGYWQASTKISELAFSIYLMLVSSYFLPTLSSVIDYQYLKNKIKKILAELTPLIILTIAIVYLIGKYVLILVYSQDFIIAEKYIGIRLISESLKVYIWIYSIPILLKGMYKWYCAFSVLNAITLSATSYWAVDNFGIEGANFAYLITNIFILLLSIIFFEKIAKNAYEKKI